MTGLGVPRNPGAPLVLADLTGCSHVLGCTLGVWQCKICFRPFDELETTRGPRLQVRASLVAPDLWPAVCIWCDGTEVNFEGRLCLECPGPIIT